MNSKLLLLVQYCCNALVQRISNCDEIQNTGLSPNKAVKVVIY